MAGSTAVLRVESIGVRGDGIAHHDGATVYLPFTAPGDIVRARLGEKRGEGRSATVIEVMEHGPRSAPACPHFGTCGGCALQHLTAETYEAVKMAWLAAALRQHGVEAEVIAPLQHLPPGTRRRARLAMRRPRAPQATAEIGFHARASHRIVDLRRCAVLHLVLLALVAPLRTLASTILPTGGTAAVMVTLADTGIDLLLDLPEAPGLSVLEAMAAFAHAQNVARLAWRVPGQGPTPVAQLRPVRMRRGDAWVDLPYDCFLQASTEADEALTHAVVRAIAPAQRVAELYAGAGTLTFPIARHALVHAVEGNAAAVAALRAAARPPHITVERRDLDEQPLSAAELARFDGIVLDPPYAGAKAQCYELAQGGPGRIVMVSCNPATFARDAAILGKGGYRLRHVQPIDSFVWSPHLELVATLTRD